MILENMAWIILVAVSYYFFCNEYFKFAGAIKGENVSHRLRFWSFFAVYAWFTAASMMKIPLTVNWFVFLIILGLEIHLVFVFDYLVSYALALFCVITGLAANVFCRSLASIALDVPLNEFDKGTSYLKAYPILFGFMFMAVLFALLRRRDFVSKLKRMIHNRDSLLFYVWTEVFIYLFLIVQLLLFTASGESIGVKMWGIKASLFSVVILIITNIYSLRVASLHYYMDKQHEARAHLIREKEDINKLWDLAFTDILTGCSNRRLLDKRLEEYAGYGGSITLAFIDVNGLKSINDQYGHIEGDKYLLGVSESLSKVIKNSNIDLFRYGGDEFVLMSNTFCVAEMNRLLAQVNGLLAEEETISYSRSISYGVVYGQSRDYQNLIKEADGIMYHQKMKHYNDKSSS